jgi:hypothetical protein
MELEGARESETYSDTSYSSQVEQEKIDKLPPESQKNIRDQITDIIIENDGWEPSDVLEDYPYEPTEAAKKDPALREQEQEAWAEQVDKYHEREAGAFGATRPPMPGDPGQPGSPGSPGSDQQAGGQPGGGQNGEEGESESDNTAGGFNPGQSSPGSSEDEVSTAGVSQSALDFLRGQRGPATTPGGSQPQGTPGGPTEGQEPVGQQTPTLASGGEESKEPEDGPATEPPGSSQRAPDGSIPIEQLGQLQGVASQPAPDSGAPPSGEPDSPTETAQEALTQANNQPSSSDETQPENEPQEQLAQSEAQATEQAEESQQQNDSRDQQDSPDLNLDTAGIIAIRDLDKLEGVEESEEEDQP